MVFHRSLVVVGKYQTGLLPSGSGAAGKIGGGEMFRAMRPKTRFCWGGLLKRKRVEA